MSKIKSFFQSIQKPFQDPINSIKNVAVVHVHHDQQHSSDLLMHPRRLQATVPAEVANQHIYDAYNGGFDNGFVNGILLGSGTASTVGGLGWFLSATRVTQEAELLTRYAASRVATAATAAAAEASTIGIQATVIGYADAGAAAAALSAMPVMPAVAVGVSEAAAAVAIAPALPIVLSATLVAAGLSLFTASLIHHFRYQNDNMHHAVL